MKLREIGDKHSTILVRIRLYLVDSSFDKLLSQTQMIIKHPIPVFQFGYNLQVFLCELRDRRFGTLNDLLY